jgi:sodium transport system permease protein
VSAPSFASRTGTVARKEIVDTLRDRRTIVVTLLTAIVAGPLFVVLVLNLVARQADRSRELVLPVTGREHAPALIAYLERQQVKLAAMPDDVETKVRDGDVDVALQIDSRFEADVAKGKPGTVRLLFDRSRDRARPAIEQAEALLRAYNREWGRARLLLRGVAPDVASPLDVEARDLATPQSAGSLVLFLVAYYGLFASLIGGMAAALDTTAGERERMSLEPLLATPATPFELAAGKWLAVAVLNATVVGLTLLGFYVTLRFAPLPAVGIPFLFGARELARFAAVLVPLVALLPAVLLYVGARGRTYKEAQANVSVLLFVVSIVPVVQLFLQRREPPWLALLPVSGQYMLLNRALRGDPVASLQLLQSYAAPALLTVLALVGVARLLARESTLAGR